MKKILLSVALIATSFITVQAQCTPPVEATTNGYFMEFVKIYEDAHFPDGANSEMFNESTTDPANGIVDKSSVVVLDVRTEVLYGVGSYASKQDGSNRHLHHYKVFIDLNDNDDFSDVGEEVLATPTAVAYNDGKNADAYKEVGVEGFMLGATAAIGQHRLRVVSQMVATAGEANTITACGPYTNGSIFEIKINVLDPNASPASAVEDVLYLVNDGIELKATIDVLANDDEGTYGIVSLAFNDNDTHQAASGAAIEIVDNKVEYTFIDGFGGHDYFTYTVTDNQNNVSDPTSVKIVVYGLHEGEGEKGEILVMEDFEEAPGATIFYDSFNGNYDYNDGNTTVDWLASGGKQDNNLEGALETEMSMSYYIINDSENITDPLSNWSFDDSYTGKKDAKNKLKFEVAGSDRPVIGMYVQLWEQKEGAQIGINVKRERMVDGVLATKVFFFKEDVSTYEEYAWTFLGFDLSKEVDSEEDDAPVAIDGDKFFVHSIGVNAPADINAVDAKTAWIFDVDLLGVYPNTYIDQGSLSVSGNKLEGVKVYPNPVANVLNIIASDRAEVSVFNVVGEVVYKGSSKAINTQIWSKGLYFVNIKDGGKSTTIKVVK